VFIRAPRVTEVGEGVRVLAKRGGDPVLLQQEKVLAATFHPELTDGSPVVDLFVRILSALG
jgi:5'-phosphate synthase pdxT subunit